MSTTAEIRYCKQCQKQLYGRADQKFCNDTCRNNFNKLKEKVAKTPPHPNEKEIFAIIRRNYDILKRLYPYPIRPERYEYVIKQRMPYDFKPIFFTGTHYTSAGEWFVCFDRGWRIEGDRYYLKDFLENGLY
jgi:hypothetical protein